MSHKMLSPEETSLIEEEERVLSEVLEQLAQDRKRALERFSIESARARELTATLVAFRRDEDKQMIASDEAVSHELRDRKEAEIVVLDQLLKKPYFARLVLEEDTPQGPKRFEYRIGFAENSTCRIIDWRKAPVAKLYYEYKAGEEYSEEILGRERLGRVLLRNQLEIKNAKLSRVASKLGNFELKDGSWVKLDTPLRSRSSGDAAESEESSRYLPQIASLLTPEQFQLIAEGSESSLMIQGIAGSGKTTVALHRLAWMLGSNHMIGDEPIASERCVVIVAGTPLKEYISKTLPAMGVSGVVTATLREWLGFTVGRVYPELLRPAAEFREGAALADRIIRPAERTPLGVDRVKRSLAMLKAIERRILLLSDQERATASAYDILLDTLDRPEWIIPEDDTKLIDKETVLRTKAHTLENRARGAIDYADDALFVRTLELLQQRVYFSTGTAGRYQHIVADEVQDFSPVDLACVIGAVSDSRGLTLIGDTNQKLDSTSSFTGWDKLRRHWAFKDSMSTFISLNLSQRSTLQILKLADYVQQRRGAQGSQAAEGRIGRVPIWFRCRNEEEGVRSAIDWLTRGSQKYPGSLSAVLCRTSEEARDAYRLLQPTFGPLLRLGDEYSFTFFEGIVVTGVEQVKGLEFTNVLLWNPSHKAYPRDDTHRNMLYTAITRAEENLSIVSWSKSSELLPNFSSPLVRSFDLTISEEDAPRESKARG